MAQQDTVLLTVHSQAGSVKIEILRDSKVFALKTSLFRALDVVPGMQSLICRGRVLLDEDAVNACQGHVIHMHIAGR